MLLKAILQTSWFNGHNTIHLDEPQGGLIQSQFLDAIVVVLYPPHAVIGRRFGFNRRQTNRAKIYKICFRPAKALKAFKEGHLRRKGRFIGFWEFFWATHFPGQL